MNTTSTTIDTLNPYYLYTAIRTDSDRITGYRIITGPYTNEEYRTKKAMLAFAKSNDFRLMKNS